MRQDNRRRFLVAASVILVRSCIGLIWASAGPLLPFIMAEYGISRGSAGWFASIAPITIAVVSLPLGIIGARFSLKKTFAVGAVLQAAGVFAPLLHAFLPILVTRSLFAMGTAITVPLSTAIAAQWFSNRGLPLFNGVTMTFINAGNAIAFAATVPLATVLAWRMPIFVYGVVALTCAVIWMLVGKNAPGSTTPRGQQHAAEKVSFSKVAVQRPTVLLGLAVMGSWALWNAVTSWLPSYYHEAFRMPLATASSAVTIVAVGGTIGCIAGGIIPLRLGRRKPMLVISGSMMGLAVLSAIMFNNLAVISVSVALFGLFSNLQNPTLFTIPMETPGATVRSGVVMLSFMQMAGNIGNFVSPLVVGTLADRTGSYLPGFFLFIAFSLSSLVAGLLLAETGPKGKGVTNPLPQHAPSA